jgi:hypothetical protein
MPNASKPDKIAPLTGILDTRSQPDEMPPGSLRWRQNIQAVNERTSRRGCGWSKLLSESNYNNTDFHDQLLAIAGTQREPITFQAELEPSDGARYLFIGTQSRIFQLNPYSGNYSLIASGMGGGPGVDCAGPRFQVSLIGDYAIFTNGYDAPFYHIIDQPQNPSGSSVNQITDLALISLQSAKKTWVWRDCVFLANVQMGGVSAPYRMVWSDYQNPTSFDPSVAGSIAGYLDLPFGEEILAGMAFANSFLIYTTKSIWELYVNATGTFQVKQMSGISEQNCLRFENTLVNVGDGHLYMGRDRIYFFNQFMSEPDQIEWLHLADNPLYANLDADACRANVAVYVNNEILISVLTNDSKNNCPDITIRINRQYRHADIIDHGFTSLVSFRPQFVPSFRDFLVDQGICTLQGMADNGIGFVNEGLPRPVKPSAPFSPTCIYTHAVKQYPGIGLEDLSRPTPAADSLCALLNQDGYAGLSDFKPACNPEAILVGASSEDWCLKQIGGVFYRERCANPTAVGSTGTIGYSASVGAYILDGYDSIFVFPPMWVPDSVVTISKVRFNYIAAQQAVPSKVALQVGISGQVADANSGSCGIKWQSMSNKPMVCMTKEISDKTSPSADLQWNFLFTGKFLHLRLQINGTGGDCLLSGIQADVSGGVARNY